MRVVKNNYGVEISVPKYKTFFGSSCVRKYIFLCSWLAGKIKLSRKHARTSQCEKKSSFWQRVFVYHLTLPHRHNIQAISEKHELKLKMRL